MTEGRAFALILIGSLFFTGVGVLGLAALGVRGPGLSLGALIPLIVSANAVSRMVMHYGEARRREHQ
jgi:hypothetical protein